MKRSVKIHARAAAVCSGPGHPTRVMALVGASHRRQFAEQARKIDALSALERGPDVICDLSIVRAGDQPPLWKRVVETTGAAASALPIYTVSPLRDGRVDSSELLEVAIEQMEGGVGMLTIHPTPCMVIQEMARSRLVRCTSRGGGLVIADAESRGWYADNAYLQILPDLALHAKKNGTVLSLGAAYRSANIFDACDAAQVAEIELQIKIANYLWSQEVGVIIESPGHARPRDIRRVAGLLRSSGFPVMPLGPIPTDIAVGQDHVASAIGATLLGLEGCAHILAAVTREEHTGGIPTIDSTLEAVAAAHVAAHIIDLEQLGDDRADWATALRRSDHRTCVVSRETRGCDRCARACPL